MDRRKFLKAGMLGGIASTLPVSNVQASEAVEPIPGALGMLYDSTPVSYTHLTLPTT